MRIMLIVTIVAYIFVLGCHVAGRMGCGAARERTSSAQKREKFRFLLHRRLPDSAAAKRIRRFRREHRRMQTLLSDTDVSEWPVLADGFLCQTGHSVI